MSNKSSRAILLFELKSGASIDRNLADRLVEQEIPRRRNSPGAVDVQRYRGKAGVHELAVFEAESLAELQLQQPVEAPNGQLDQADLKLSFQFGEEIYCSDPAMARSVNLPLLLAVWWSVPPNRDAEFGKWYEQEHIGLLTGCPEWRLVRRFRLVDEKPGAFNHLALHYLASEEALTSPERDAARKTEWRNKLAQEPWFEAAYAIFDRIEPLQIGANG